jgi:hypothetical protein
MRKGFSMITAIFVIVIMASLGALILNLSGKMVKETTTRYFREQAMLLAKSYTEYAIMAVTANDQNRSSCLNDINGTMGIFSVDVNLSYIGNASLVDGNCRVPTNWQVSDEKTPLSVLIDVFVRYPDPDHPDGMEMTYHRRTLQKI